MTRPPDPAIRLRAAAAGEMAACAEIWRAGIDDYSRNLGRLPLSPPTQSFLDLLGHVRATDPATFLVAERDARIIGFTSAVRRSRVWFLSMLFVLPQEQAHGIGRALLDRVLPRPEEGLVLATCTDSAQPISNALYSRFGIVPRVPVLELVGRPNGMGFGPLPGDVHAVPFEALLFGQDPADATAPGAIRLRAALEAVDVAVLGYAHPEDHAFLARGDRRGYLYEGGGGAVLGYGYAARSGRIGPLAVVDPALTRPVLGHLMAAIEPLGAYAAWVPGANDEAVRALLEAGLFIEDLPALLCWTQPFADFERYIPFTLGLL